MAIVRHGTRLGGVSILCHIRVSQASKLLLLFQARSNRIKIMTIMLSEDYRIFRREAAFSEKCSYSYHPRHYRYLGGEDKSRRFT